MNALFANPHFRYKLLLSLDAWRGTPFFPNMAKRGVGVDCIRFDAAVYGESGFAPAARIQWPKYAVKGGDETLLADLMRRIEAIPGISKVWERSSGLPLPELVFGDALVFSNGKTGHHMGMFTENETMWHCPWRGVVGPTSIAEVRAKAMLAVVYRVEDLS